MLFEEMPLKVPNKCDDTHKLVNYIENPSLYFVWSGGHWRHCAPCPLCKTGYIYIYIRMYMYICPCSLGGSAIRALG